MSVENKNEEVRKRYVMVLLDFIETDLLDLISDGMIMVLKTLLNNLNNSPHGK